MKKDIIAAFVANKCEERATVVATPLKDWFGKPQAPKKDKK